MKASNSEAKQSREKKKKLVIVRSRRQSKINKTVVCYFNQIASGQVGFVHSFLRGGNKV